MGRESKADLRAERDDLAAERDALVDEANRNAKALQELAADITAGIESLPWEARRSAKPIMEQHARRVLALASSYVVESRDPDPEVMRQLSRTRKVVVGTLVAAVIAMPVGFGEAAGGDGWQLLKEKLGIATDHQVTEAPDLPPGWSTGEYDPLSEPTSKMTDAGAVATVRHTQELTQTEMAAMLDVSPKTVSRWERGTSAPTLKMWQRMEQVFGAREPNFLAEELGTEYRAAMAHVHWAAHPH